MEPGSIEAAGQVVRVAEGPSKATARPAGREASGSRAADFIELAKPRITGMVLLTTLVGFLLASTGPVDVVRLALAMIGTALVAAGASALNQLVERQADGLMLRTAGRPLPAGRLHPREALAFGAGISAAGVGLLGLGVNALTALLALAALTSYLFVYTPLKKRTPLCTVVGAVPGAIPPVMGWTAASGELGAGALALFAILFVWQLPHFLAIGWIYREDYARGGFPMIPVRDSDGRQTGRHAVAWSLALVPASLLPGVLGLTGTLYLGGALLFGAVFLAYGIGLARFRTVPSARGLLLTSVAYLPALLALMVFDRNLP